MPHLMQAPMPSEVSTFVTFKRSLLTGTAVYMDVAGINRDGALVQERVVFNEATSKSFSAGKSETFQRQLQGIVKPTSVTLGHSKPGSKSTWKVDKVSAVCWCDVTLMRLRWY